MLKEALDADDHDPLRLADEWRAAHDHFQALQHLEAGWADRPPTHPVPAALEPLLTAVHADPIFQRAFSHVPSEIGIVDLDHLTVRHRRLNLAQLERVKERVGSDPSPATIFRLCLPFD